MTRRFSLALLCSALTVAAAEPDAGEVLRSFVTYRAMIASQPELPPAQKAELEKWSDLAKAADKAGNHREALRDIAHGNALLQNMPWTPATSLSLGLEVTVDHIMWQPGKTVRVTVSEKFPHEGELKEKAPVLAVLSGMEPGGFNRPLQRWDPIDLQKLPWTGEFQVPPIEKESFYFLEIRLLINDPVILKRSVKVRLQSGVEARGEEIRQRAERLKAGSAFPFVLYAADLYRLVDSGSVDPTNVNFRKEFEFAHGIMDALEQGIDPVTQWRGDVHLAYRSKVDDTLQPYRLFIPAKYDGKQELPLVVALHGMGGDENTMFDAYRSSVVQQMAEQYGYLVVCPKGRGSASMYEGTAERDVMDVMAEVRRQFRVDRKRLFLMGHSMGGYGTWSIAMNHPDVFAALAPVSGGGDPAGLVKIRRIPEFVTHGSADTVVEVKKSREMVEAARKLGIDVTYKEIEGGDHAGVFVPAVPGIFAWFTGLGKK